MATREATINLTEVIKLFASRRAFLWTIFVTALVVRLVYISTLQEGYYFSDFKVYERAALSLLNGEGFNPEYRRPPLYPLFLAANYLVFGQHFFTMRLVQALLGAYCSVLIFVAGSRIFGDRVGKIAAWISVFYPYYIFLAGLLYPTLITAFLLIGVLYFLTLARENGSVAYFMLATFCLGMATMATPVSLAFLPFMILWLPRGLTISPARRWLVGFSAILVIAGCMLPWSYYYYERHGRIILVDARAQDHMPNLSGDSSAAADGEIPPGRLLTMISHPGKTLARISSEFLHFWTFVPDRIVTRNPDYRDKRHRQDQRLIVDHKFTSRWLDLVSILTYGPVFILALIGLGINWKRWELISLPLLLLLSQAVGYSFFFTQVRYRLPVEFCLMIFAGVGVAGLYDKYKSRAVKSEV